MATGFQHITNSNANIIKAVRSEAQALLTISHTLYNQTRTIERDLACRSYAQDLFTATRQEILDLRLHKTPRHVLNDLIEVLDLHRWFSSEKMKNVKYSELISTIVMYTGNECIDCIGFFATFPLIHPDQVYPNSTNIRSIGMVVKDQVIKGSAGFSPSVSSHKSAISNQFHKLILKTLFNNLMLLPNHKVQ